jgi:hypothetical protein
LCGLALFLALPIIDFGAISARSQVARLQSGKVTPAKFDWAALAFKFGPAGRAELTRISQTGAVDMRTMAATALKAKNRWDVSEQQIVAGPPPAEISVTPSTAVVPPELRQLLLTGAKGEGAFCSEGGACRVYPQPDGANYVVFMDGCANLSPASRNDPKVSCVRTLGDFAQQNGKWTNVYSHPSVRVEAAPANGAASLKQESDALDRGDVLIVPVEQHQVVVGGKKVGDPF